jgi:hypothetical protein
MTPRSPRAAGRDALVVLGALLLLGALCGLLWWLLVDPAQFTKTARGGAMAENDLGKKFNADAWFVVIGLLAGLLAGLVLSAWRSRDALLTSGLLLVGSVLAAGTMLAVGHLLGPSGTEAALRAAAVGGRVPEPLGVDTALAWLGWPVGVLAGTLFVLLGHVPPAPGDEEMSSTDRRAAGLPG